MVALGFEVIERSGSRVLLRKGTDRTTIHKPHPRSEVGRATIREIAKFLSDLGVTP